MKEICREKPEDAPVGKLIQIAANRFRRRANDNLTAHGLTLEQMKILSHLAREGGEAPQAGLETVFAVRRSSMTAILQNMEKSGLLTREKNEADARVKKVILTEKGKGLYRELHEFISDLDASLTKGFSEEERAALKKALLGMLRNLDETERTGSC